MGIHNYYRKIPAISVLTSMACICLGCSSRVEAPKANYAGSSININKQSVNDSHFTESNSNSSSSNTIANNSNQSEINMEQEALIEKQCLEAWRKCLAGNKKESLAQLKTLSKKYPKSSSVLFITAQVLEKSGNKEEAINYYERAANDSDFAIMSSFKLAEALRTKGNTMQAISRYRKLISIAPDFAQAHLGLAKALKQLDPHSKEANEEIKLVLKSDPDNKEAKTMLGIKAN